MGTHGIQRFRSIPCGTIEKVFAGFSAPEGIAVKAMARMRTQFDVPTKIVVLDYAALHKRLLGFSKIMVDRRLSVIPQTGYCSRKKNGQTKFPSARSCRQKVAV
jgi:hypothetical protein